MLGNAFDSPKSYYITDDLIAIICAVLQRRAAARQDLHTFLSNDELRRYLHTDSHESGQVSHMMLRDDDMMHT